MHQNQTLKILGVKIDTPTLNDLSVKVEERLDKKCKSPFIFACANPHSLIEAQNDSEFINALNNADATVADGVGIVLVSKLLNLGVTQRITGHDFFCTVMSLLNKRKLRVFFFGSSEEVLVKIKSKLSAQYPDIELAGTISPPYGEWSEELNEKMISEINSSQADVLWVGMTAPKQEKWIEKNKDKLDTTVIGAIGAVFDFFAGTYPRAPKIATKLGLEWLFRLLKEPKRMWKRNFISTPSFIYYCFVQHFISKK